MRLIIQVRLALVTVEAERLQIIDRRFSTF